MERVQEQHSEEEEEFDPEYMDVHQEEVVTPRPSKGRKSAPLSQQPATYSKGCEGTQCGLGLTLKERGDGEYYVKKMEKGGPCEASGEVSHSSLFPPLFDCW